MYQTSKQINSLTFLKLWLLSIHFDVEAKITIFSLYLWNRRNINLSVCIFFIHIIVLFDMVLKIHKCINTETFTIYIFFLYLFENVFVSFLWWNGNKSRILYNIFYFMYECMLWWNGLENVVFLFVGFCIPW